jgi:hypothetical protein
MAAFLFPNQDTLQHTPRYNKNYSIILLVCMAETGVQNMSKYPGVVFGGDSNLQHDYCLLINNVSLIY